MEFLHWIKAENHPAFWTEIIYSNWWKTFQNHFWYNNWCKEAPKKAFWFQFPPKFSIIKVYFLHWPGIWINSWHPSSTGLQTTIGTLVTKKKWNTDSICLSFFISFFQMKKSQISSVNPSLTGIPSKKSIIFQAVSKKNQLHWRTQVYKTIIFKPSQCL